MTTQRRSLSTALEVTPEKLAFIKGTEQPTEIASPPTLAADEQQKASKPKRSTNPRERQPQASTSDESNTPLVGTLLVPLTTRLHTSTADALKRAYLERKLRGRTPNTQQEIVEEALQAWLRDEGHL